MADFPLADMIYQSLADSCIGSREVNGASLGNSITDFRLQVANGTHDTRPGGNGNATASLKGSESNIVIQR